MTTFSAKTMSKSESSGAAGSSSSTASDTEEQVFVKSADIDDHDYVTAPHAQVEIHVTTDEPTNDDDDEDDDGSDDVVPQPPAPRQSPKKLQLPKDFKENSGFDMLLAAAAFAHCQSKKCYKIMVICFKSLS